MAPWSPPGRRKSSGTILGCSTPTSAWQRKTTMPAPTEHTLVIEGLVSGYGGADVLHDVSLTVAEGAITCVVGPNGAGKSTLLATISGLLPPRRGTITLRGEPLAGKRPRQILAMGV